MTSLDEYDMKKPRYRFSLNSHPWTADDKCTWALYDMANHRWMESRDEWRGNAPTWFVPVFIAG